MSSKRTAEAAGSAAKRPKATAAKRTAGPSVLLVGTGEYTTGYVNGQASDSDKSAGVVALTFFDLRRLDKVGERIALCGTNGTKFPGLRTHLQTAIGRYKDMDVACETYPADDKVDREAFKSVLSTFKPGDVAVVTTPDNTHYDIAMAAINAGLHVMVTKPLVKSLQQHREIVAAAKAKGVLVCIEYHKRYDPIYSDAVNRIRKLGDFGYFSSYMSQPKTQLTTFKSWAGKSSDISYYLNSHHIDIHEWAMLGIARPVRLSAMAATGVCKKEIDVDGEDTITLTTQWRNIKSHTTGVAVYTSSWATPKTDVHSEQRFMCLSHEGQVKIDQAHRGFSLADDAGFHSMNPLYMRYTPDRRGYFVGQQGYGYRSFDAFVDAVNDIRQGKATPGDFDGLLPTAQSTMLGTAILEAGRLSLDNQGRSFDIVYDAHHEPVGLQPTVFSARSEDVDDV